MTSPACQACPPAPESSDRRLLAEAVVASLARAMRNISFYSLDHPSVAENVLQSKQSLDELLARDKEFHLKFFEGAVVAHDRPLRARHGPTGSLAAACQRRGVESLTFLRGLEERELLAMVDLLTRDPLAVEQAGGFAADLAAHGVRHLLAERLRAIAANAPQGDGDSDSLRPGPRWAYLTTLDILRSLGRQAHLGLPLDVEAAHQGVRDIIDTILSQRSIMLGVTSIKGLDEYTFTHALHICILSLELGLQVGLTRPQMEELGVSGLLHDVGKIFVPLDILRKPGRLTEEEFALVQRHPVDGSLLLYKEANVPPIAPVVAFEHHMHRDLSGYPKVSEPREINLYSLMTSLVDVYDALTTARPYRPPLPPSRALEVMQESYARQLEPRLLASLVDMMGPWPAGALVRLDSGRLAVVSHPDREDPERPFVHLLLDEEGPRRLDPKEVSLAARAPDGSFLSSAVEILDPLSEGLDVATLLREMNEYETPAD